MTTKYSKLFGKTTREATKDISVESHKLLYQGGFIRQSVAGRYYFLPLGLRVRNKIQQIIREEMNNAAAQEVISPVLQQISLWKETKRDEAINFELMQVEDRRGEKFALGGTAEEMIVDLVRGFQTSYRDLPFNLYQFSTKFRDEARAYGGLLRIREFVMKDAYSFDKNKEEFEKSYELMKNTYLKIYERCGIHAYPVEASGGVMGDKKSHQFEAEFVDGEDKYFVSEDGKYIAHEDVACFIPEDKNIADEEKDMMIVNVERGNSVEEGCRVHNNESWQHIKNVIYKVSLHKYSPYYSKDKESIFVHVVIRGDLEVNEDKLQKILSATTINSATDEELIRLGYIAGFISPIKVYADVIIGDKSLITAKNYVTGGDEKGKDRVNMNYGKDFSFDILYDLSLAYEGAESPDNHGKLTLKYGTEVGHIFELEYKYSKSMNATFMDEGGKPQAYYMGCYGLGLERTLQMAVETHHDANGIIWPRAVAPYDIHLVTIGEDIDVIEQSKSLIEQLEMAGYDVLWDEREKVSPGIKLKDADLIGCPLRIVVSKKTIESGQLEIKYRDRAEAEFIAFDDVVSKIFVR